MKLVHPEINFHIQLPEGELVAFVIENPKAFYRYSRELYEQANGSDGAFVLSEDGEVLKLNKLLSFLPDPFAIDINQRQILNKVYSMLQEEIVTGKEQERFFTINQQLLQLIDNASSSFPFPLCCDDIADISVLFKAMNVALYQEEGLSFVEQLIDYIKISSQLLSRRVFVFHHMQDYVETDHWEHLEKVASHTKTTLVFLEKSTNSWYNNYHGKYIIDKDLCEVF